MKGIMRTHHAIQSDEARADWLYIAEKAVKAGRQDLVLKYQPPVGAGWRAIDKSIAGLRGEMGWPPVWQMRADGALVLGK